MNYKFDIKKMTEQWNNQIKAGCEVEETLEDGIFACEDMSEMIQRHAFKLGYSWPYNDINDIKDQTLLNIDGRYILIYDDLIMAHGWTEEAFKHHSNKEIGLDFFSIEPELKTVTVKMSMKDYKSYSSAPIGKYWELVE